MRRTSALAMAFFLSAPSAGMAIWQQGSLGPAKTSGQAPAVPTPAETTSAASKEVGQSAAKKTMEVRSKRANDQNTSVPKRRKTTAKVPHGAPRKIVVRQGGATEPAERIAPGMNPAEAIRQRQDAERLMGAADDQLKRLAGRPLDARQQETAGQIRNYIDGARSALQEGDLRRASTLALKADLLAEDLVKH